MQEFLLLINASAEFDLNATLCFPEILRKFYACPTFMAFANSSISGSF